MRFFKPIKKAFKEVYGNWSYYILTLAVAVAIFVGHAMVLNYKLLIEAFSFPLLWGLVVGSVTMHPPLNLMILLSTSLLAGVVFSLSIFLIKRQASHGVGTGIIGITAGVLAPACSSCALGLAGILGLGGFFAILPWKGMEFAVLALIILLYSVYYLSDKIVKKVCK